MGLRTRQLFSFAADADSVAGVVGAFATGKPQPPFADAPATVNKYKL